MKQSSCQIQMFYSQHSLSAPLQYQHTPFKTPLPFHELHPTHSLAIMIPTYALTLVPGLAAILMSQDIGSAANFGVLGASTVTNTGVTTNGGLNPLPLLSQGTLIQSMRKLNAMKLCHQLRVSSRRP